MFAQRTPLSREMRIHLGIKLALMFIFSLCFLAISGVFFLKNGNQPPVVQAPIIPAPKPVMRPPTRQPQTAAPQSTTGNVGFSVGELPGLSSSELSRRLDGIQQVGGNWIRVDIPWSSLQPTDAATYHWEQYDRVIKAARQRGINILLILDYTPKWARKDECAYDEHCPPRNDDDFARYASAVVRRYSTQGVDDWEIWNEPNMRNSWLPAANPEEYAALLDSAYRAIKEVDPTATVITGGLGPTSTEEGNISPRDFLTALYAEKTQPSFDAVGFHPYSFPALPGDTGPWNAWQQMANTSTSLRSIMIAHDDAAKKIWITEYGAPTNGPGNAADIGGGTAHADHVTEALQAQIITEAFSMVAHYEWTGPIFWYGYQDLGIAPTTNENFFGLLRYDGSHKPAYNALKQLLSAGN